MVLTLGLGLALLGLARPVAAFGTYDVEAGPGGRELTVEARFQPGAGESLELEDGMGAFVERAQRWSAGGWTDAAVDGDAIRTPGCGRAECRVRYRVLLERAGRSFNRHSSATVMGEAVLAPPSMWLARPTRTVPRPASGARYQLRVRTPPGTTFVSGLFRVPGAADTYAIDNLEVSPYSGFANFDVAEVKAGGGTVEVAIAPARRAVSSEAIRAWVQRCAAIIASYYRRAPLPRYVVIVLPGGRRPVGFGTAMGYGGGSILVWVGAQATEADLAKSWVLCHEMVHLGFPNVPGRQHWMEEGLATYVEEVARVRAGWIGQDEFWDDLRSGFPKGLLQQGEQGLNGSDRWGPLYWGGALFWFLADVEIREKTNGKRGLDDALAGVLAASGGIAVWWPPEKVIEAADKAVGAPAVRDLYDRFGRAYMDVDLEKLWTRVGPATREGIVTSRSPER
jgi:hypothetical protein